MRLKGNALGILSYAFTGDGGADVCLGLKTVAHLAPLDGRQRWLLTFKGKRRPVGVFETWDQAASVVLAEPGDQLELI